VSVRIGAVSDTVFLDILPGILLALEPARHPTATRPRIAGLRVAVLVLGLHGAVLYAPVGGTVRLLVRDTLRLPDWFGPPQLLWRGETQFRQPLLKLGPFLGTGFFVLVVEPSKRFFLQVEEAY